MNHDHPRSGNQLAERVLTRIEDEHLLPRPRWEFLLRNYIFWCLGALAVALGALAFSATLFEIRNIDWRLSSATHPDFLSFFFAAAPIFWVVIFILLILVGYINVRYTTHGYRYSLLVIALGAGLVSVLLGSGMYAIGFGKHVEEIPGGRLPFYRPLSVSQQSWWLAPEKGLLGGQVMQAASSSTSFVLTDFSDRSWHIDGSDLLPRDLAALARGGKVRIVGAPTAATSSAFHACFVFPWEGYEHLTQDSFALASSTTERNLADARSEICKGIRPYQQLRSLSEGGL